MFPTRKRIVLLHLSGHVIRTKPDHPFFTSKGWADAGDLRAGDLLRTRDGSWASVQAVGVE
jgi:intein/homing endonuclease